MICFEKLFSNEKEHNLYVRTLFTAQEKISIYVDRKKELLF